MIRISRRTSTTGFTLLGALAVAIGAAGCSSAAGESTSAVAVDGEELGEALTSCVDADATAWAAGVLTIDATANTSGVIIVSPGNSVVKVNGRVCKAGGTNIPLSSVNTLVINGRAGSSDSFVLDFSSGLPKGALLHAGGIVVNGNEALTTTKTPDTFVFKGSTGADFVSTGLDVDDSVGQIDISLTASSKVANIELVSLGRQTPGPFSPNLIFSLGGGDDTFSGDGGFPVDAPSARVNYGMSVYGGAGNDRLLGGSGPDKIVGGGQVSDTVDYSANGSAAVFVDTDTPSVSVWGGDLRGVKMSTGEYLYIDTGGGSLTQVGFTGENTPAAIVARINTVLGANVASTVGNRLRLATTGSRIRINGSIHYETVSKLGLQNGLYESVGNDGAAGGQLAVPWEQPTAIAASPTAYNLGEVVVPIVANGYWYKVTVAGTSTGGDRTWGSTIGATVADAGVTWTTGGKVWKASTAFAPGDTIWDIAHAALFEVTSITGQTGTLTTLNGGIGGTKTDGGVTWTTLGGYWHFGQAYSAGEYVVKTSSNGFYYKATTTGSTDGSTEPTWPTTIGATVVDNSVTWVCEGHAALLAGATRYALGDVVRDSNGVFGVMTDSAMLSGSSAPSMVPSPVPVGDGDLAWTYVGGLSEHDDVQSMAVINGADGDDVLVGGSGANTLNGNDGNDVLMGGPLVVPSASCPLDKLNGGAGDDWFDMGPDDNQTTLTQDDCNQVIAGGSGTDVVDYSKRSANGVLLVKLDGVTASGEQSLTSREADKIGSDVEVVLAGGGPDLITGSDNADYLFGGPGNDHVYGGKGDDHLYGGAGDDSLYGDLGNDTFYELSAFPASTAANEALRGTTWAGLGAAIYGSEKPGAGDDLIMGGSDLSEVNKVDFTDAPNPVAAAICSDATAINANLKSCAIGSSDYVHVSLDGTTATAGASGTHNSYINVEYLAGSLTQPNVFIGSANAEVFEGGSGLDVILGQGGQDTLSGSPDPATGVSKDNTSIDVLCGGDDDDYVAGGSNSIVEGEGQMDQAHAHLLTTAVLLGGTSVQAPSFCHDPSNAVYTMTAGTNMCFGSTNKTHCAN